MEPPTNPAIDIDDITDDEHNREILRQMRDNDPGFTRLNVIGESSHTGLCEEDEYYAGNGGLEWLGYFMSKNDHLTHLFVASFDEEEIDTLSEGINFNHSISSLEIHLSDGGHFFRKLVPFFKKNNHLRALRVRACEFGREGGRDLAVALAECPSNSFSEFTLDDSDLDDRTLARIITALGIQPELKNMSVTSSRLGSRGRGCLALTSLLLNSKPETLTFESNEIGDDGVELLTAALKGNERLTELQMGHNCMTNRGFRALSTLLMSSSKLTILNIQDMHFDDDAALMFSKVFEKNSTLKELHFSSTDVSSKGWEYFARSLCDSSTVVKTLHSNHRVSSFGFHETVLPGDSRLPANIEAILELNGNGDKVAVARNKILMYHDLDMSTFSTWDFKLFPMLMKCFEMADQGTTGNIDHKKLSSIFKFIRGDPDLFIDSVQGREAACANKKQRRL